MQESVAFLQDQSNRKKKTNPTKQKQALYALPTQLKLRLRLFERKLNIQLSVYRLGSSRRKQQRAESVGTHRYSGVQCLLERPELLQTQAVFLSFFPS